MVNGVEGRLITCSHLKTRLTGKPDSVASSCKVSYSAQNTIFMFVPFTDYICKLDKIANYIFI